MDLGLFFSPEELATWADLRTTSHMLYFTSLGIKLLFLSLMLVAGVHLAIRRLADSMASGLYNRPTLKKIGAKVAPLRGVVRVFEKLGRGKSSSGDRSQWLVDAFFPILFVLIYSLLTLPLRFFSGYILEHERGLSNISLAQWWIDMLRSLGIGCFFSAFLGIGLFGLARRLRRSWWLWLWGAVAGGLIVWSILSPYRARIYNQFTPLEEGKLKTSIESIMKKAGFELSRVEVIDTSRRSKRVNAFIMGEGPTKRVILSDNLVAGFHPREIKVAIAHEAGHLINEDQARTWMTTALAALLFLALCRLIFWLAPKSKRLGLRPGVDPAILPLIILVLQLLFMANGPLSAYLDRIEERAADREALRLTEDPVAFCSLMIRLNRLNQSDPDPPGWVKWYFHHHPSTADRLDFGFSWAEQNGISLGPGALPLPVEQKPGS
ncbi:MAG: M48 family metalloprotease [Deltaproteobacteria bacterium]|nr:M48 family metalloprotease [Deltaproteobacteria bacterium]